MRAVVSCLCSAVLSWLAGCSVTEAFTCSADEQCVADGAAGRCEAAGVCSFPDEACPSGHRYGGLAGELSGECVEVGAGSGPATELGTSSGPPGDSVGLDGSSSGPSTSSTSTTSATSTSSTTAPAASTTEPEPETTSTTGNGTDPYGPCMDASQCADPGSTCIVGNSLSVCAPPCEVQADCPPLRGSMANVVCTRTGLDAPSCVLLCMGPAECPDGMQCELVMMSNLGFCGWA